MVWGHPGNPGRSPCGKEFDVSSTWLLEAFIAAVYQGLVKLINWNMEGTGQFGWETAESPEGLG